MSNFLNQAVTAVVDGINTLRNLQSLGVQLHVATQKGSYRAGELVSGTIWINSSVPVPIQSVALKITGWEITKVVERKYIEDEEYNARDVHNHNHKQYSASHDSTSTGRWVDIPHHQQNQFLNQEVIIANYSQLLNAGSYAFPFEFMLPENLPGCFLETGSRFEASIKYNITAICRQLGGVMASHTLTHQQQFYVEEKLNHKITEQMVSNIKDITFCCCFNQGTCTISAVAAKNAVFPGDFQNTICDIQNDSKCAIKTVQLSIQKDLKVYANGYDERYTKQVVSINHAGLPSGYKDTKEFHIQIPMDVTPTTNSSLITSNYRLKIKLIMRGASNVSIDMPLTVYPASQSQQMVFQPPPAWNVDANQINIADTFVVQPSAPPMPVYE
eukprot:91302_1